MNRTYIFMEPWKAVGKLATAFKEENMEVCENQVELMGSAGVMWDVYMQLSSAEVGWGRTKSS